jgi:four helix bundle protein
MSRLQEDEMQNSNTLFTGPRRLHAYRLAVELVEKLRPTMEQARRIDADLADHMRRALNGTALGIAEGAGRSTGRDRARFYAMAKASGYEVLACMDLLGAYGLNAPQLQQAQLMLERLLAMVAGLVQRPA